MLGLSRAVCVTEAKRTGLAHHRVGALDSTEAAKGGDPPSAVPRARGLVSSFVGSVAVGRAPGQGIDGASRDVKPNAGPGKWPEWTLRARTGRVPLSIDRAAALYPRGLPSQSRVSQQGSEILEAVPKALFKIGEDLATSKNPPSS